MKESFVPNKPKIPDYFYVIPLGDDRLLFRTGARVVRLGGRAVSQLIPKLLPLLNGTYQVSEILTELEEFSEQEILSALAALTKRGLVEDATARPTFEMSSQELERYSRHFAFFSQYHEDKYEYQGILKEAKVMLWGLEGLGSQVLSALATCGIGEIKIVGNGIVEGKDLGGLYTESELGQKKSQATRSRLEKINPYVQVEFIEADIKSAQEVASLIHDVDLVLVCTDSPAISLRRWVNAACLEKGIRWTSATLNEKEGVVGPSIVPFETACYTCYELRRKANETFYEEYLAFEEYLEENPDFLTEWASIPPLAGIVANFVTWEAVRILTNLTLAVTYGRICTIDFSILGMDIEEVLKLPYCPTCGQLQPSPKLWLEEIVPRDVG